MSPKQSGYTPYYQETRILFFCCSMLLAHYTILNRTAVLSAVYFVSIWQMNYIQNKSVGGWTNSDPHLYKSCANGRVIHINNMTSNIWFLNITNINTSKYNKGSQFTNAGHTHTHIYVLSLDKLHIKQFYIKCCFCCFDERTWRTHRNRQMLRFFPGHRLPHFYFTVLSSVDEKHT